MAAITLLIGIKGDKRTLEASGIYSEIKTEFKSRRMANDSKSLDKIEIWDRVNGVVMEHDFGRASRKQINLEGGINPHRKDNPTEEVETDETDETDDAADMDKDAIKNALDEMGIEYDARLGVAKLRAIYDASVSDEK